MPKKTKTVAQLRKQADTLYQQLGMLKNKHCLICGSPAQCMHHFFTKGSSSALRYALSNGIPICQHCHCKIHLAQDPSMVAIILKKRGDKWFKELDTKRHEIVKTNKAYYQTVIEALQHEIELNQ